MPLPFGPSPSPSSNLFADPGFLGTARLIESGERMDARSVLSSMLNTLCSLGLFALVASSDAATFQTENFVVTAPSDDIAKQVAETAEMYRRELAVDWLGKPMQNWYRPCPIQVKVGQIGAGGSTTFTFDRGEVFGWKMEVQGTLERILDSVIPHEVNHTIFACHFRRPLPRWADEGAATLVEHVSERKRQEETLAGVMQTSRRIPLQQLLSISEYPSDTQQVYTLYAEGYSLADFLVSHLGDSGRATFLKFLADAEEQNWQAAIQKHYGFKSVTDLEKNWTGWVMAGSPRPRREPGTQLAGTSASTGSESNLGTEMSAPAGTTVDSSRSMVALAPLPAITRGLRKSVDTTGMSAPELGELQGSVLRGQSPAGSDGVTQSGGRIVPRRDAHPDLRHPGVSRLEMIQRVANGQARRPLVESARSVPKNTLPTPARDNANSHNWSDYNHFPATRIRSAPTSPDFN